jgi:Tfp pilus assembly ATPase PilU
MQSFDQALLDLFQEGLITYEEALLHCTRPADFGLKVKGIQSTEEAVKAMESQRKSEENALKKAPAGGDSQFIKY